MHRLNIAVLVLLSTVCINTVSAQDNTPAEAPAQEKESTDANRSIKTRVLDFFKADSYRASYGIGSVKLNNPEGFDIDSSTYIDGFSNSDAFGPTAQFISVVGEQAIGWKGRQKSLWGVHYDSDGYNGLRLQNLMFNAGVAIDPSVPFALGGRLAAGAGLGIVRSTTFFDNALHPAAELWASAGVQLGRLTFDLSYRARQAMGTTLDDRSAAPRTETRMLSIGWVF